ncbi:u1 small nuclear ribonucleoprotein 70 kda-like [Stylonychia lemnae]|uniref:U1 small nuclear ribonucleoprotein 70 kDa-like n=1 Tax=Stylonychia lemnae TaxID=5949 RepID=A0A078A0H9_STYLE|nr:u1 small nuclear ribonucleoprotein 70 kda-like [Stylonychia lemnae]|eukprot:CDW74288.1 u1 small nuclear ribonucleoprotein 70 kda-like [Stylonychia lemnae]
MSRTSCKYQSKQSNPTLVLQPSTLGFVAKQDMPHHLSILFRARPPLEFAPHNEKGKCKPYTGYFDKHRDYFAMFEDGEPPKKQEIEKLEVKKERIKREKLVNHLVQQNQELKQWNPYKDPTIKGDPFKTIVVSRLSYKTDESTLRKEFEPFGRIKRIRIIVDQKSVALERGNGRKVDGARVVVDYERGRTKTDWIPRRLGGGKGDKRRDRETERQIRELKKTLPQLRSRSRSQDKNKSTNTNHNSDKLTLKQEETPSTTNGQNIKSEPIARQDEEKKHIKGENQDLSVPPQRKHRSRSRESRERHHHRDNRSKDQDPTPRRDGDRDRERERDRDRDRSDKKDKRDKKKKDKKDKKTDKGDKKKKDKKEKKDRKDKEKESSKDRAENGGPHDQVKPNGAVPITSQGDVKAVKKSFEEAEPGEIQE